MDCCLFACLVELPAKGLLPVMEIPHYFFASQRSICAVPQADNIAHLGGIFLFNWQTKPCERAVWTENINLDCHGMAFFPADCEAWILGREADGPVNVLEASTGLFPMLTCQEPSFETANDWLKFAYITDWGGGLCGAYAHSPRPVCGSGGG